MCLNCGKQTSNPKFCGRSCAASYNNKAAPKRNKEGKCALCGRPAHAARKYCPPCGELVHKPAVDRTVNSNQRNNSDVRSVARRWYTASGRPQNCAICGYDKHVDICHIKDIRNYPHGTTFGVVNAPENLIALCKNHHWEFDHEMF